MRILICGASGFVGSNIHTEMKRRGHTCIRGVRNPRHDDDLQIDYLDANEPDYWAERLENIDVVINAIGVLRDTRNTPMALLHSQGPASLFRACVEQNVQKIVNISAIGVDSGLDTAYFRTKKEAEDELFTHSEKLATLNIRPSLVYGKNGTSAKMFRLMAALPVHMLPMGGVQKMQPVHINDLVDLVGIWLDADKSESTNLDVVGREVVTMREMLDSYRTQQQRGKALHLPVPGLFVRLAASIGDYIPFSPLCTETLSMLELGNTGELPPFEEMLGRKALGVSEFFQAD